MNKLRAFSYAGGGFVAALAAWAAVRYSGSTASFVEAFVLGLVAAGLPQGLARVKAGIRSLRYRLADEEAGFSEERGSIYVSETTVDDPVEFLETVRAAVRDEGAFESVQRGEFGGVPGLNVSHSGFHSSLIRVADGGRVVVTGASERTGALADVVGRACSLSFERTRHNPFKGIEPIRGGPRVFLGVIVFAVILAGVNAVGAGAYSTATYNPAERAVLVGMDAHADVHPGVSTTDAQLRKAAFLVNVLNETSTEIRWEQNDTALIADHGRQAVAVSTHARTLLDEAREGELTPAQADRADRIEADLREAERSVAEALDERANEGDQDAESLRRIRDRLHATADGTT